MVNICFHKARVTRRQVQARAYLIIPCLTFRPLFSRGLTSKLFFLPSVLVHDGPARVGSRSGDGSCGSMYGEGFCNLDVVSWYDTLLAVLQPPDFPPLVTGRVVENQDFVTETNRNLVVA